MKSRVFLAVVLTCVVAASVSASAIDELKMTVDVIMEHQDEFVFDALDLSEEQYAAFHPMYLEYRMAMDLAAANRISLIKDFVEKKDTLDDVQAAAMIEQFFASQESALKIKKHYTKKAMAVLPATKAVRFLQVENKIAALVDFKLAEAIALTR